MRLSLEKTNNLEKKFLINTPGTKLKRLDYPY